MDLNVVTQKLGVAYKKAKDGEKELKESRGEFFEACDEAVVEEQTLAQQTITVPDAEEEDVVNHIQIFYPGWRYVEENDDGGVIIEEDPAFQKYVHINPDTNMVFRRNVSQAGPSLDDERLKIEDPALWKRITETKVQPATRVRVLKDLEEVNNKDLAAMQEYFVPGRMTVKLDPPRKAKSDELDA